MLLTEYDEAKTMELFKEEGYQEGWEEGLQESREEGANMLGKLVLRLISLGRNQDVEKVASDPAYREKLYAEFGIGQ